MNAGGVASVEDRVEDWLWSRRPGMMLLRRAVNALDVFVLFNGCQIDKTIQVHNELIAKILPCPDGRITLSRSI